MATEFSLYNVHCEWGEHGASALAPHCDVVIVVDVLSFCTCVDIAVGRGARIYPYPWRDGSAETFARRAGAMLAGTNRSQPGYTLSPASLRGLPMGSSLVLPSPNGATLALATGSTPTFAGCLRNARAVAEAASRHGRRIAVVASGERWADGNLRPALEDWLAAGAIVHHLSETIAGFLPHALSPEALAARAVYREASQTGMMKAWLLDSVSGRELCEHGFAEDVTIAAQTDVSTVAPMLVEGAFRNATPKSESMLSPDLLGAAGLRALRPTPASHRNPMPPR
ncbi:2-phosphosulfolactate phosphatase [Ralstonia pseudosolanacearum]|uniref:2-phosphosulfolactate phosphatase n=1 Tax=Ralstonia pseudosolanacearum TaxID=1310165 RepID=UPI0013F4F367|nr:2-phosphosulfolactate phosphatase [Ralstonia pseudosolanacearum]MBX9427745.1 2-phosphosulfolactate phosphatase [Ralstonia pseudosolanacearum]MDO3511329.1 2-phosphosulfolactate phosphatase [Ralstonia pseudosolanacearum]QIK18823.1 2-phosphosulfolactate phosphatase [Ralstonia solanacearum]